MPASWIRCRTEFMVGDARRLPLPDASFDVVVNVESSHCYASVENVLTHARRVLRPGGLCFADLGAGGVSNAFMGRCGSPAHDSRPVPPGI